MGDGSSVSSGIRISTDSFSIKDCVRLVNVLIIKYNVKATIHIQKNDIPRIYIGVNEKKLLIPLIKPHMIPSMYYKLDKNESGTYPPRGRVLQSKCFSTLSSVRSKKVYPYPLYKAAISNSYNLGIATQHNYVSDLLGSSSSLAFYLAGLIEANGHFNILKERYDSRPKERLASIEVIFISKDRPLAELFQAKLGGNLYFFPNKNLIQ